MTITDVSAVRSELVVESYKDTLLDLEELLHRTVMTESGSRIGRVRSIQCGNRRISSRAWKWNHQTPTRQCKSAWTASRRLGQSWSSLRMPNLPRQAPPRRVGRYASSLHISSICHQSNQEQCVGERERNVKCRPLMPLVYFMQ